MWHALSGSDALAKLDVDARVGLSSDEARARLARHGPNQLEEPPPEPLWKLVLAQFDDLLVKMLLAAATVSFCLALTEEAGKTARAMVEPFVILLILVLNAIVGVWQEKNAESAIEALKEYEPNDAEVMRDGAPFRSLRANELVPGDIVRLSVGSRAPADVRLLELTSTTLRADQAILTGESEPTLKEAEGVATRDAEIQSRTNLVFSGTTISYGSAVGVVVETGASTEMGRIGEQVSSTAAAASPLKLKLDEFGALLSKVIAVICALLWLLNIGRFADAEHGSVVRGAIHYFKTAIALAVAAIPEGLPAVVTTCLALGTRRMAKRNAIVRYLPSVETLGATAVICSDKTGTLTSGRMAAREVLTLSADGSTSLLSTSATGYDPTAHPLTTSDGTPLDPLSLSEPLRSLGAVCALCNASHIHHSAEHGSWAHTGEPTEAALRALAEKIGAPNCPIATEEHPERASSHWSRLFRRVATLEFSRERRSMGVITHRSIGAAASEVPSRGLDGLDAQACSLFVKGAPDSLIERCDKVMVAGGSVVPLTPPMRASIEEAVSRMSGGKALRCLACALRHGLPLAPSKLPLGEPAKFAQVESGLTLIGVVGLNDPPRPEVARAIETCSLAGIRVVVITGDNPATAAALCQSIGLLDASFDASSPSAASLSLTGREFGGMGDEEQRACVASATLFSRVEPCHKLRLVSLLQEAGHVVAMTGDGVNDAPALKRANIGVAMGSGTAVAKGAADMVLADDNFSTIVAAVEEGRSIFNNTQAFIRYLISSNIGEVACIFIVGALGFPESMTPVQLLWVNLVTDGLPATALTFNPPDSKVMRQPPRPLAQDFVDAWLFTRYMIIGLYVGLATVGGFAYWYIGGYGGSAVPLGYLMTHHRCGVSDDWPAGVGGSSCQVFSSLRPRTVALSILVTIEMLNALNALSQNESLLRFPPTRNPWLLGAIGLSLAQHLMILYVPWFNDVFGTEPLDASEWQLVLAVSVPVLLVDELLKLITRRRDAELRTRMGVVSSGGASITAAATTSAAYEMIARAGGGTAQIEPSRAEPSRKEV